MSNKMKDQNDLDVGSLKPFITRKNRTKVQTMWINFEENLRPFSKEDIAKLIVKKGKNFKLKIKVLNDKCLCLRLYFPPDFVLTRIVDESIRSFLILEKELGLINSIDDFPRVNWKFPILVTESVDALANDTTSLIIACKENNRETISKLIAKGIKINETDLLGNTALMYSIGEGDLETIKILLDNGANIKIKGKEMSLLQFASNGDRKLLKFLLKEGAEVDSQNIYSEPALYYAVMNKRKDLIKILVENGANPHISNYQGKSPYSLAKNAEFKEIVDLFDE
jgi:hypothetical protein